MKVISCDRAMRKILPNEITINTYKNVHTGPNTHAGGDQDGFLMWAYRLLVGMFWKKDKNTIL